MLCSATQALPRAGGILDQDNLAMTALVAYLEAVAEKADADKPKQKR
jgi:hypothetical protein